MQSNNFYSTDTTLTDGIELTDHLLDISEFTDSMADAYLMGYIPADKMPAAFMPVYLSGGVGEMSAIYHPKNTGWGYGWLDINAEYRYATSFTRVNGSIVARPDFRTQYRLFNAIKMARANTGMQITITYLLAFIDNAVYDGDGGTTGFVQGGLQAGGWGQTTRQVTYTFDQFVDIIKNDSPLFSITETGNTGVINGKSYTFAPRPSEFGDSNDSTADHKWVRDSGQGAQAVVMIDGYQINSAMNYANGNGGGTTYYLRPFTYPDIDAVGNFAATKAMLFPAELSNMQQRLSWAYDTNTGIFELTPGNTQTYTIADYNINPGGFNFGTITDSDADFTSPTYGSRTLLVKKSLWLNATGYGTRKSGNIQNLYTPMDIYRHALLYHKHTTDGTQTSYGANNTWTTRFDVSSSPTDEILTGSFSSIAANLRPWQLPDVDITSNTFIPEDIPDSGSDEGEESGDKIDFIMRSFSGASNFITNYVMTRHQVGIFGNRLWTSWADSLGNPTEMIKNIRIFYTGGDTGSIDIGSVMPFIVSMKIFPFDLSNFIGYETDGIKIGTGHYPINVPGCWYLPRSSVYVSCGTVTIPRIFNDFRDYENMNIMCYVPYCGTVELNPGDVIGRTLSCTYGVDLQSGGCTAYIIVDNNYPVATISGQMGSSVPLTATNSGQLMSQRLSDISGASALIGNTTMQVQRESERPHPKQANMDSAIVGAVLQAADSVPQRFRRSAISCPTMSAGNGLDAFAQPQTPYIQMRYGIYDLPSNYKHSIGRISTKSNRLSEYKDTGFITCSNVDTSPLNCHNDEKAAIKAALESGVYI